jgi:Tol biopolymer transport system component
VTAREFPKLLNLNAPAVSPDGDRIAYSALSAGADPVGLYVSPALGGSPTRISVGQSPSWSPDGASIAYMWHKPNGATTAATVRVGSDQPPFEPPVACQYAPQWSPSGTWIACSGPGSVVFLVSPDGKKMRTLPGLGSEALAWSKDSEMIYGIPSRNGRTSLVELNVRTGALRTVADYQPELVPKRLYASPRLSLSPDGKRLAMTTQTLQTDLWILEGFAN